MPETNLHTDGFPDCSQGGTHDKNENIPVFMPEYSSNQNDNGIYHRYGSCDGCEHRQVIDKDHTNEEAENDLS